MTAQSLFAAKGDVEAMQLDEDIPRAMEYGMPPTGGVAMGIHCLLMAPARPAIRAAIGFPLVHPE